MKERGGLSLRGRRSAVGPLLILAGALVALLASLLAILLEWSLPDPTPGTQPGLLERFGEVLVLGALGVAVAASLGLVVAALASLLFGRGSGTPAPPARAPEPMVSRATPVDDGRWMGLVEECVEVVDELDEHMADFDPPRREVAGHVMLRLGEILERSGVEVISEDVTFDRVRHTRAGTYTDDGAPISETLSPGFAVGRRVLRRARVR